MYATLNLLYLSPTSSVILYSLFPWYIASKKYHHISFGLGSYFFREFKLRQNYTTNRKVRE